MPNENEGLTSDTTVEQQVLSMLHEAFAAARAGDATALLRLLTRGVPANVRTERGDGLLMLATYHGHEAAARVLLEHGADPELANDRGQTPLGGVAFKGDVACARLLLDHGARVGTPMADGKTAHRPGLSRGAPVPRWDEEHGGVRCAPRGIHSETRSSAQPAERA